MQQSRQGRSGGGRGRPQQTREQAEVVLLPQLLNEAIVKYFQQKQPAMDIQSWTALAEVPTSEEISNTPIEPVQLVKNLAVGSWSSKGTLRKLDWHRSTY